jgi:hypothetical protein
MPDPSFVRFQLRQNSSRRPHHLTYRKEPAVFLADDVVRVMQQYGRTGETARTVVPKKFADSIFRVSGGKPEYMATTPGQVAVLNRNLEILPTVPDAIQRWLLGKP